MKIKRDSAEIFRNNDQSIDHVRVAYYFDDEAGHKSGASIILSGSDIPASPTADNIYAVTDPRAKQEATAWASTLAPASLTKETLSGGQTDVAP